MGEAVRDTSTGRVGLVMGRIGGYVQLRPPGGGREWDASPDNLESVPMSTALGPAARAYRQTEW
nr:hypothetical protein [Streptomyces sp. CC53]